MEIGSIFDIDIKNLFSNRTNDFFLPFMKNNKYNYNYFFNTGRSAIEHLLKQIASPSENKKILLPAFNCSSVIDAVKRAGINYDYYSINEDLQINIDSIKDKMDANVYYVYIIHYFGKYHSKQTYNYLKKLQDQNIVLIEDISHALFTSHPQLFGFGDYVLGSIRKWLPIPDGAFLSSSKEISMENIKDGHNEYSFNSLLAQIMKNKYLKDNTLNKKEFLKLNEKATKALFSDYTIRNITDISKKYILSYDMDYVIEKRIKNYKYFMSKIKNYSYLKPILLEEDGVVPFGMVVYTGERNKLLQHLIQNNIYCNIHWDIPTECREADEVSYNLSEKILTIPCDQRYDENDIDYIMKVLDSFREG